jgi:hypothetical protein
MSTGEKKTYRPAGAKKGATVFFSINLSPVPG